MSKPYPKPVQLSTQARLTLHNRKVTSESHLDIFSIKRDSLRGTISWRSRRSSASAAETLIHSNRTFRKGKSDGGGVYTFPLQSRHPPKIHSIHGFPRLFDSPRVLDRNLQIVPALLLLAESWTTSWLPRRSPHHLWTRKEIYMLLTRNEFHFIDIAA